MEAKSIPAGFGLATAEGGRVGEVEGNGSATTRGTLLRVKIKLSRTPNENASIGFDCKTFIV
jgi:hypothetical protein